MKPFFFLVFTFLYLVPCAQDGKIIEQAAYSLPDSLMTRIAKRFPLAVQHISNVNFFRITYLSDGLKVKGFLAIPKKEGKYPCIIYNRGGNNELGKLTEETFTRTLSELANNGYINDGGEGKEEFGGSDVNDVLNLIPALSGISQADTLRIGMYGWSRGGMMTYLALAQTTRIKAAVVGSGVTDLLKTLESRPAFEKEVYQPNIPEYANNTTRVLKERSAAYFAGSICKTTPILVLQGSADWRVTADQTIDFIKILYEVKHPTRFILFEGGDHLLNEHKKEFGAAVIQWFHHYLRDGKPWPSLEPHGD